MDPAEVARRAHRLWELEGRPEGRALAHWLLAEAQLRVEACRSTLRFWQRAFPTNPLVTGHALSLAPRWLRDESGRVQGERR